MTAMPRAINPLLEMPVQSWTNWDKVQPIESILADLENGTFFDASRFLTQMMRDDRIRGTMSVRINSVLGKPWHMEAAGHDEKRRSARATRAAEQATELWSQMAPEPELAQVLQWALMLGMTPLQKTWTRTSESWIPSFRPWHPGAVYYDINEATYKLQYNGGILVLGENDPNWMLVTPFGYKYGRINGMVSALAMPYLCRRWAMRDRARHSEIWGQPIKQVIAPADAEPAEVNAARRAVALSGSETVIGSKQGVDGNKWDFKLHEVKSDGHQVFSSQITHLDDVIAVMVLGQTMSTTGQGGLGAQDKPGDVVRRDVMRFDANIISWIARNLLRDWADKNFGDPDLAPELVIEVDPPEDEERKARIYGLVADSILKFQMARVNVDIEQLCDESGIPLVPGMEATETPHAAGADDVAAAGVENAAAHAEVAPPDNQKDSLNE